MSDPIVPNCPELLTEEQLERLHRQRENQKRIDRERATVRGMIRALRAAGWEPHSVDDGGDEREATTTETAMLEAVFAVDQATAFFKHANHPKRCCVVLVCGEGDDVIADHSDSDSIPAVAGFSACISAYMVRRGLIG